MYGCKSVFNTIRFDEQERSIFSLLERGGRVGRSGGGRHDSKETPRHWQAEIENDRMKGGRRKMHEEWNRIK